MRESLGSADPRMRSRPSGERRLSRSLRACRGRAASLRHREGMRGAGILNTIELAAWPQTVIRLPSTLASSFQEGSHSSLHLSVATITSCRCASAPTGPRLTPNSDQSPRVHRPCFGTDSAGHNDVAPTQDRHDCPGHRPGDDKTPGIPGVLICSRSGA